MRGVYGEMLRFFPFASLEGQNDRNDVSASVGFRGEVEAAEGNY